MPRDNICVYLARVCFFVRCSDCGNVCCVVASIEDSVFSFGMVKYVACLYRGCDVFCLICEAWSCRFSCMGSMGVSSCRCCMCVSCVHHVTVFNVAFCMTCRLLMLVEDTMGDHMEEAYSRAGLMSAL